MFAHCKKLDRVKAKSMKLSRRYPYGPSKASFSIFNGLFKQKACEKTSSIGIQTHDLLIIRLLIQPQDQGSLPHNRCNLYMAVPSTRISKVRHIFNMGQSRPFFAFSFYSATIFTSAGFELGSSKQKVSTLTTRPPLQPNYGIFFGSMSFIIVSLEPLWTYDLTQEKRF